jgi:hypothetical protein
MLECILFSWLGLAVVVSQKSSLFVRLCSTSLKEALKNFKNLCFTPFNKLSNFIKYVYLFARVKCEGTPDSQSKEGKAYRRGKAQYT